MGITRSPGFDAPVTISVDGLEDGVTGSVNPNPAVGQSTISFAIPTSAPESRQAISVIGSAGGIDHVVMTVLDVTGKDAHIKHRDTSTNAVADRLETTSGEAVKVDVAVVSDLNRVLPGTVTLYSNDSPVTTTPVVPDGNGISLAIINTSSLPVGLDTLWVAYTSADAKIAGSISPRFAHVVNPQPTASLTVEGTVHDAGQQVGLVIGGAGGTGPLTPALSVLSSPSGSHPSVIIDAGGGHGTFGPDVPGDYTLRLVQTDSRGISSKPFDTTIHLYSDPMVGLTPSLPVPDVTQTEFLTAVPTDPDSACAVAPCTYQWHLTSQPPGSTVQLQISGAQASFVPLVDGPYVIQVTLTDAAGGSDTAFANMHAVPVFDDQLTANPDQTDVGLPSTISATFSGGNCLGGDCSLNTPTTAWSLVSPASSHAILTGTDPWRRALDPDVKGDYIVRLDATDDSGYSVTRFVKVVGNNLPTLSGIVLAPGQPAIGNTVTFSAADDGGTCSDHACGPNDYVFQWTLTNAPAGSQITFVGVNTPQPTLAPDFAGSYGIQLTITDSLGQSATATAVMDVLPHLIVDSISATPNPTDVGTAVNLTATVSGKTSYPTFLEYSWTIVSAPKGSQATLANADTASPTVVPDLEGDYVVSLTVLEVDNGQVSARARGSVTFHANAPVTIQGVVLNPSTPTLGTPTTLSIAASGGTCAGQPCGASGYTYNTIIKVAPANSVFQLSGSNTTAPVLTTNLPGSYTAQATVSDDFGRVVSTITVPVGVEAPTGLVVLPTNETTIRLSWTRASGADSYDVLRSVDGTNYSVAGTPTSPSFVDTGLDDGTRYTYEVASVAGGTQYGVSAPASGTTPLSVPTNVHATASDSTGIDVAWSAVPNATGYTLFRSTDGTSFSQRAVAAVPSYHDSGLTPGTTYFYRVGATNSVAASALSAAASATTLSVAPVLIGVNPNSGPVLGGNLVSISGSNFQVSARVVFGTTNAGSVSVISSSAISAVVPPATGPGPANVTVINPDGQSATLTSAYTYLPSQPPPSVGGVSPNAGPLAGGNQVTVTGANFAAGATVLFGGKTATVLSLSPTAIAVLVPPGTAAVPVDVTVTNSDGQTSTLPAAYRYS